MNASGDLTTTVTHGQVPWARGAAACLLALVLGLTGCGLGQPKVRHFKAQYLGLEGRRVAVLVAAPDDAVARQPDLAEQLAALIATTVRRGVAAADVTDPRVTTGLQQDNPFWSLQPPHTLYQTLDAQRLVIVDLTSFRLRDPENNYLWLGTATAQVSVYESDAADPANPRFAAVVSSRFPEDRAFGFTDAQPRDIALGLSRMLARDVARLFHDYEVRQ